MKSDFEKNAAQEAVKAVEERWRRRHEFEQKMARRGKFGKMALFLGVVVAAGIGFFFWQGVPDGLLDGTPASSVLASVRRLLAGGRSDFSVRTDYARFLKDILRCPVKLLSDLPAEANPKRAPGGTSFTVLSPSKGGFELYRLTADGKGGLSATLCSPFSAGRGMTWTMFTQSCGRPYLVEIGGFAYLCGSKDVKDAEKLKAKVSSLVGVP